MADPVFFTPSGPLTAADVARIGGGEIAQGSAEVSIARIAPLEQAGEGDLTFFENPRYLQQFRETRASIVICAAKHVSAAPEGACVVVSRQPYRTVALVMQALFPDAFRLKGAWGEEGISPAAHIHPTARLEEAVTVEPGVVIGANAEIGRGTVICANAVIGAGTRVGRDGYIGAGATVSFALVGNRVIIHPGARIGQDGFGFAMGPGGHLKVPQIGRVVIQDDVEIGANSTIDRGSNRDTVIGEGTKIDNDVQIGHNVEVGRHCVLVAKVGISGSSKLCDYVAIGGYSGLAGHITMGVGAQLAGGSMLKDDMPAGERWIGMPARPIREWTKEQMALKKAARQVTGKDET
ncbi:UDP-3-O-(3-hydroxymyristoyl)glucosamine N-acyltransferase [Oryzibacter oryziterrae]|uniref:UDP-3-O-(3-hydroxymyristoyl)glucosamine N-acyltransferase n=1 Tax=Oryzibacter oryziterrae TaxID=2766474 RepID=UPI001F00F7B8|nr:UDP-3-O-(3-hydroxymyristoyl)glucosamine N-acyltransferase [Oryzibacter oryziterrae]